MGRIEQRLFRAVGKSCGELEDIASSSFELPRPALAWLHQPLALCDCYFGSRATGDEQLCGSTDRTPTHFH